MNPRVLTTVEFYKDYNFLGCDGGIFYSIVSVEDGGSFEMLADLPTTRRHTSKQ
jgi:hypothetical protein